jgi:hypothetical protein
MEIGDRYIAHAPGAMFGLDGRTVRVWAFSSEGRVEVIPEEAWPEGEGCPVGVAWDIAPEDVADVLVRKLED